MPPAEDPLQVEMVDREDHTDVGTCEENHVTEATSVTESAKMALDTDVSKLKNTLDSSTGLSKNLRSSADGNQAQVGEAQQASKALFESEQIKLDKDKSRLMDILSDISDQAAQQVFRKEWRKILFNGYNEEHIVYLLKAGLKNANASVLQKVVRDDAVFKDPLRTAASRSPAIIASVLRSSSAAQLSEHAPKSVIDKVVEWRIKHAPARDLINWLAAGERLGFREDDALDEFDETVVPNIPIPTQKQVAVTSGLKHQPPPMPFQQRSTQNDPIIPPTNSIPSAHGLPMAYNAVPKQFPTPIVYQDSLLLEQERNRAAQGPEVVKNIRGYKTTARLSTPEDLICPHCLRQLPTVSGYRFHMWKRVCKENKKQTDGRSDCPNCLSSFLGKQGLVYHQMRSVCQKDDENADDSQAESAAKTSRSSPSTSLPTQPPMYSASQALPSKRNNTAMESGIPSSSVLPKLPMNTPRTKEGENEYRMSPADLPPEKRAAMDQEIIEEDEKFRRKMELIPKNLSETERLNRETGYKNANATRKSQIRKSYGVSLRLRERDKKLRAAAEAATPSSAGFLEQFRAPSSSLSRQSLGNNTGTPVATGFSSINTPGSSSNGFANTPSQPHYKRPQSNAAGITHNPRSSHPDTLNHARESYASIAAGFGVLRASQPSPIPPMNYQQVHQTNKRRRTSEDTSSPGTGYSTPQKGYGFPAAPASGMAMIHAEDAATKYAKIVNSSKSSEPIRRPTNGFVPQSADEAAIIPPSKFSIILPSLVGTGTKESAFTIIDSSSEGDEADIPSTNVMKDDMPAKGNDGPATEQGEAMDMPLPSIEDSRSE